MRQSAETPCAPTKKRRRNMTPKFNPRFDDLLTGLQDQAEELLRPWEGDCWRFQAISHPRGRDILNGKGAFGNGGRWNAPHTHPVVYGSTTGKVALEESEANERYYGMVTRKARIYVCIGFKLSRVLDLTHAPTLRRLQLVAKHLRAEDWRKIQSDGPKVSPNVSDAPLIPWVRKVYWLPQPK